MAVRCAHCGEELLGAVNRCWKCGREFAARPTVDGLPPVRIEAPLPAAVPATEPLEARVLEDEPAAGLAETAVLPGTSARESDETERRRDGETERIRGGVASDPHTLPPPSSFPLPPNPLATPAPPPPQPLPPMQRHVPPRPNIAALGGAYSALVVGIFALALAPFRWEAAIVAFIGLIAGIWGIYSPRRNWALVGMLLCALAMGWGTYTGVNELWLYLNRYAPIVEETPEDEAAP
jgi:hypothetical protein